MSLITPLEFFTTLFPDPLPGGQLMLWSTIRRSGKTHTDWCFTLRQAGRLAVQYRRTRRVWFGVALQDRREALSCARRRNKRATAARVRGAEGSATVLPALWAHLDFRPTAAESPGRVATGALFAEVPQPPSIVVSTLTGLDVYWLLDEPWVLAGEDDRRQAKLLLAKVRWALARAAPAGAFEVDQATDLAGLARVPGTLCHRPGRRRPEAVAIGVDQFPLPGDADRWRYRRGDFEGLEAPPERPGDDPWAVGGAGGKPAAAAEFRPVWRGCSWLRHCHDRQATLPEAEWRAALSIVGRCRDGSESDGRNLAHRFSERHPGYAPHVLDDELARILGRESGRSGVPRSDVPRSGVPRSGVPAVRCGHVAAELGAWERHCGRCPHRGQIDGPIDLGRRERPASSQATQVPGREGVPLPPFEKGGTEGGFLPQPIPGAKAYDSEIQRQPQPSSAVSGGGLQVEIILRAALPPPDSPASGPAGPAGELLRVALACLGLPDPAGEPGSAAGREHLPVFLAGLDELLAALGGGATARVMAEALAAGENQERFATLRSALRCLIPDLDGNVPTAQQLGYLLRSHHRRTIGGRTIVQTERNPNGVTWSVQDAAIGREGATP